MANHGDNKSGLSKFHTFIILVSLSTPYIWPTCLLQDDLMKYSNDLSMPSHTNLGNPFRNFLPWSVRTLAGVPNLLNTLSRNAYVAPSLL